MKKVLMLIILTVLTVFLLTPVVYAETIDGWEWVDEKDPKIVVEGEWSQWPVKDPNNDGYYKGFSIVSYGPSAEKPDATIGKLSYKFNGTKVRIVGPMNPTQGLIDVSIDGKFVKTADCSGADPDSYVADVEVGDLSLVVVFESDTLSAGEHTITISPTAEEGLFSKAAIDAILYQAGSAAGTTPTATKAPATTEAAATSAPVVTTQAPATTEPVVTTPDATTTVPAATTASEKSPVPSAQETQTDIKPAGNGISPAVFVVIGIVLVAAAAAAFILLKKKKKA